MNNTTNQAIIVCPSGPVLDALYSHPNPTVIAVDGGINALAMIDVVPQVFVGDGDSINAEGRAFLKHHASTVKIISAPRDKDFSDLDLALRYCVDEKFTKVSILGATGGRLDHQLAVLGVCTRYCEQMQIKLVDSGQSIRFVAGGRAVQVWPQCTFSVMGLTENCEVSIENAQWNLENFKIGVLSDLGLSNFSKGETVVTVEQGKAVLIENSQK